MMQTSHRSPAAPLLALLAVFSLLFTLLPAASSQAANRPFPKYEMTFQKIWGTKDPNYSPGDPGDGCLRDPNARVTHLTTFGFNAMLDECEGVRTTIRFYLSENSPGEPTLQFRFGTTWQYRVPGSDELFPKPVENFTYDGQGPGNEKVPYDPENAVVTDKDGNLVRMNNGKGFYEPIHFVFEDTFGPGEEHIIQFDSYLPAGANWGGLSWGTGSTGDTEGGSIGATANGLWVQPPAKMDIRYVRHSEYLAARGFEQDAVLEKDLDYGPGLPERKWATSEDEIKGSTFEIIECLEAEGQQLADLADSQPVNEIYPELPFDTPSLFEDKAGNPGFAHWPWQWSIYQDGEWHPKKGLRPMNRNNGNFDPYYDADGNYMALPYKPTVESVTKNIPGYEYVDNDITILEKGKFDTEQPEHSYKYLVAPNVYLRRVGEHKTQHFYYTYRPIPGTFELEKSAIKFEKADTQEGFTKSAEPLEGAEFELYEVVDTQATPCGLKPNLENTEKVTVCQYQEPNAPAEFKEMLEGQPQGCEEKTVRKIVLDGTTEGRFKTDAAGKFTPSGDPSLEPGNYLLREVSSPDNHLILNEWIPFEVPLQTEDENQPVKVHAENYRPGTFELEKLGVDFTANNGSGDYVKSEKPLEGATFALYERLASSEAEGEGIEKVTVCEQREPKTAAELEEFLKTNPQNCAIQAVRKVVLEGTDGTFTTDEAGKFSPAGEPNLIPGEYLLRELSAPGEYQIVNEWIPFTIYNPTQAGQSEAVQIIAKNYLKPTTPPYSPPEDPEKPENPSDQPDKPDNPSDQPDTPEGGNTPDVPKLSVTGSQVLYLGGLALALLGLGLMLTALRKRN